MSEVDTEVNEQVSMGARSWLEGTPFPTNIIRTISPNDEMTWPGDPEGTLYFKPGASAMKIILDVLRIVDMRDVRKVCDFACGHGRVLRYLRAAFPDATITPAISIKTAWIFALGHLAPYLSFLRTIFEASN